MNKKVSNPKHYRGNGTISCMDALESMMHGVIEKKISATSIYWWGCAFKYLWRWPWKNGIEDIDKSIQCLKYLKKSMRGNKNA